MPRAALWLLVVLSLSFGMLGCQTSPSSPTGPDTEDVEVASASSALLDGRTLTFWDEAAAGGRVSKTVGALAQGSPVLKVMQACLRKEALALWGQAVLSDPLVGQLNVCPAESARTLRPHDLFFSANMNAGDVATLLALTCVGHWALNISHSVQPTVVTTEWEILAGTKEGDDADLSLTIDPPSTSDAATWALVSAEYMRAAAAFGAELLPCFAASNDAEIVTFPNASGGEVSLGDYVAMLVSDAAATSLEAAAQAQSSIVAAADAARSTQALDASALSSTWRNRLDSRLEVAGLFATVPEFLYGEVQPLAFQRVAGTSEGTAADVFARVHYTTSGGPAPGTAATYSPPTRLFPESATAYLLPASSSSLPESKLVSTWRVVGMPDALITTSGDLTWLETWVGRPVEFIRHEGRSAPPNTKFSRQVRIYRRAGSEVRPAKFFIGTSAPADEGTWTDTGESFRVLLSPEPVKDTLNAYPVAEPTPLAASAKRAEELLRSTRVNPCITALPANLLPWCENVQTTTKEVMHTNLLRAMRKFSQGADTNAATREKLLASLGVEPRDLTEAAYRIVQQNQVLGRAIVPDPDDAMLVHGTSATNRPVDPAFLYARLAGRPSFQADLPGYTSKTLAPRGGEYTKSSLYAALDFYRVRAEATLAALPADRKDSPWTRTLRTSLAWAKQHLSSPIRHAVTVNPATPSGQVARISLHLQDLKWTTNAGAKGACNAWLNEAGLECGLTGRIGGFPCDPSKYRFVKPATWVEFSADPGETKVWARFRLDASSAPSRTGLGRVLKEEDRIYLTCDAGNGPKPIAATTVVRPFTVQLPETWYAYQPPMSDVMLESLSDALAADQRQPEMGALSCAGIPRDVKIPLDDELSDALTGADSVESSFAHYLKLARAAADEADALGEQLIDQGLQMDMRAEAAREELEDLCGGTVNVPALEDLVCSADGSCDLSELLASGTDEQAPGLSPDLAGLRDCLGEVTQLEPVDAAVGDQQMIAWQYVGAEETLAPCTPPSAEVAAGDPNFARLTGQAAPECPVVSKAARPYGLTKSASELQAMRQAPNATAPASSFGYVKIDTTLNISVSAAKSTHLAAGWGDDQGSIFACGELMALRQQLSKGNRASFPSENRHPALSSFITRANLKNVANLIGYEENQFGIPTVTLGGKPWIQFKNSANGPLPIESVGWPCVPHPLADARVAGHDQEARAACQAGVDSMFCGGRCGPSGTTDAWSQRLYRDNVRYRLRNAVRALKGMAGVPLDGVTWSSEVGNQPAMTAVPFNMYVGGQFPDWHPNAGTTYFRSNDGKSLCYNDGSKARCSRMTRFAEEDPYGTNGFPEDPWFLYTDPDVSDSCPNYQEALRDGTWTVATLKPKGCGHLTRFLDAERDTVVVAAEAGSSSRQCPAIPSTLCSMGGDNGEVSSEAVALVCGESLRTMVTPLITAETWNPASLLAKPEVQSLLGSQSSIWDQLRTHFATLGIPYNRDLFRKQVLVGWSDAQPSWRKNVFGQGELNETVQMISAVDSFVDTRILSAQEGDFLTAVRSLMLQRALFFAQSCGPVKRDGALTIGQTLYESEVLDALELACAQLTTSEIGCDTLMDKSYIPKDVDDFPTLIKRVQCAADSVEGALEKMWLHGIPKDVATAVQTASVANIFPAHRGTYGEQIGQMAAELENFGRVADGVMEAVRDLKLELQSSAVEMDKLDLQQAIDNVDIYIEGLQGDADDLQAKISAVKTRQAITSNAMNCVAAAARAMGNWRDSLTGNVGGMAEAAAICVNAGIQIKAEREIAGLQSGINQINDQMHKAVVERIKLGQRVTEQDKLLVLLHASGQVNIAMDRISESMHAVRESMYRIQGHLAGMEKTRQAGRRAAAKVMLLGRDDVGRVYAVNNAMRARMNTLRIRYERARKKAVQLAYLARRAVEQKLGVDLSRINADMTLVPAPRSWVDTLCTASGVDYERIRESGGDPGFDYQGAYLGDWVGQLESFVESYRLDYPFGAGSDLLVMSLRDEVVQPKASCLREGWNSLYFADGRFSSELESPEGGVWQYTCQDGTSSDRSVAVRTVDESPFLCAGGDELDCDSQGCVDSTLTQCRVMGEAKAGLISGLAAQCAATPSGVSEGTDAVVPGELPSDGVMFHYRADRCNPPTSTTDANQTVCDDLGPTPARMRLSRVGGGLPTLDPTGIGGRPSLELPADADVRTSGLASAAREYTVSIVYRKGEGVAYLNRYSSLVDGLSPLARIGFGNGDVSAGYLELLLLTNNVSPYDFKQQRLAVLPHLTPTLHDGAGHILTMRAGAETKGVEFWLDGVLRAHGPQPAVPSPFQYMLAGGTGTMQVGELIGYYGTLTDEELHALHAKLADDYDIDLEAPSYWLSAEVLSQLRSSGASTIAGYSFGAATNVLRDASSGLAPYSVSGSIDQQPLTTLNGVAGGPSALAFDGVDDRVSYRLAGYVQTRPENQAAWQSTSVAQEEYSVTLVARCDGNGSTTQRLFTTDLPSSTGPRLALEVMRSTGRVQFVNLVTNETLGTESGVVACGTPFVVTLRGSASSGPAGTTDLFVNGQKVFSGNTFQAVPFQPTYGGASGVWFKGALADARINFQSMSDGDVTALHGELGTTFGIQVASSTVVGNGEGTVGGPARLRQVANLEAGEYWLSWYQKADEEPLEVLVEYLDEGSAVQIATDSDDRFVIMSDREWRDTPENARMPALTETMLAPSWVRYFVSVDPRVDGEVAVGFLAPPSGATHFAAPQLERRDTLLSDAPNGFFATGASLSRLVDECGGKDASPAFRELWHRGCEYYCDGGPASECAVDGDVSNLPQRCFYELDFALSLDDIERGTQLDQAGFSRGNFNYRFETLAVNIVGKAVKDCSLSASPSSCSGANFLQFSLYQDEPFRIRNYDGDMIHAPLPPGRIQQAKALLVESQLTNPLSEGDRSLVEGYMQPQLNGRPLDGTFKLRLYDADGLNFRAIEDVQVALRYRYWTRFE